MIDITTRVLSKIGFRHIEHALNGAEALRILRERRHALVISDLHMGSFSGLHLLSAARSDNRLRHTRFLMVTGDLQAGNVAIAKRLGVDAYLLKPFSPAQMRTKIIEMLSIPNRATHG